VKVDETPFFIIIMLNAVKAFINIFGILAWDW